MEALGTSGMSWVGSSDGRPGVSHWQTQGIQMLQPVPTPGLSFGSAYITNPEKQLPEDPGRFEKKSVKEAIRGPLIKCSAR